MPRFGNYKFIHWNKKHRCFFDTESKSICTDVSLRYDSSISVEQNNNGEFVLVPKILKKNRVLYVKRNQKEEDSLEVHIEHYPLRFNIINQLPNHHNLNNYNVKGLYISDTRYHCDSAITNFRILRYSIELLRGTKVVQYVKVNKMGESYKLKPLKKLVQPKDLLFARNIRIATDLGVVYTINSYLLREIQ